jgi:hypothetical protein
VFGFTDNVEELSDDGWKNFLRRHWKMTMAVIGFGIGAAIGGILVFLWVVDDGQANGLFPSLIGDWTVAYCITFFFSLILWEFIFIGIPVVVVAALIYMLWWRRLPEDERKVYQKKQKKKWPRRGASRGSGDGLISFLVTIVWLIIVWLDDKWNLAF